jgi:class 3 adenylate cyclase
MGRLQWLERLLATWGGAAPSPSGDENNHRLAVVQHMLEAAQATANAEPSASTAEVLGRVIQQIQTAFGVHHACIHFARDEAAGVAEAMRAMQACPVAAGPESLQPHLAGLERAMMERAATLGRAVQVRDAGGDLTQALAGITRLEDGIVIPIAYRGELFAWINVYAPDRREFDAVDEGLLRTIGGVLYGVIKKDAFVKAIQAIRSTLESHFSPRVVDKLISSPEMLAHHGSERLDVTVLFSDIRGFTALSERLDPETVATVVSEHLETMADVVFRYDGIVDKYIGDSVMAVFGSPMPQSDHPRRAVAAAVAMIEAQRALEARWQARLHAPLAIGVGVHTGIAVVGDVGVSRREFTHLGDTVNLASRLKDVARPWQVLISAATYERARDVLEATSVPPLTVKGKAQPVIAFEAVRYTGDTAALLAGTPAEPLPNAAPAPLEAMGSTAAAVAGA